jgi:hypothetical protein
MGKVHRSDTEKFAGTLGRPYATAEQTRGRSARLHSTIGRFGGEGDKTDDKKQPPSDKGLPPGRPGGGTRIPPPGQREPPPNPPLKRPQRPEKVPGLR